MAKHDSNLIEYVLGTLDNEARAQMDNALVESSAMREELEAVETVLGNIALAELPFPANARLRKRLLMSLDPPSRYEGFVERLTALLDLDTARIRELLQVVDQAPHSPWQEGIFPGQYRLSFNAGQRLAGGDCQLVFLAPGTTVPAHRHAGDEWGFVLKGRVSRDLEGKSDVFASGDIMYNPASRVHSFKVSDESGPLVWALVAQGGTEWMPDD